MPDTKLLDHLERQILGERVPDTLAAEEHLAKAAAYASAALTASKRNQPRAKAYAELARTELDAALAVLAE